MAAPIPKRLVRAVLQRDGICVIASPQCVGEPSCADHRVGRGMGGNPRLNVLVNLIAACGPCNSHKEDNADFAAKCIERGVTIRRSQSTQIDLSRAANMPVTYPDGRRWFLLDSGGREELTGGNS
jgi:hypothetical protein